MLKVYGSKMCSDCRNCELNFKKFNIEYEYFDINESLKNLKQFLIYRDTKPEVFERLVKIHDIGIPCIVDNDDVFTDWEGYLKKLGHSDLEYEMGEACSLDHKGC